MSKKRPPRGPGRPKGSKTQYYPITEELPARCPNCGSTRRSAKQFTGKVEGSDVEVDLDRPQYAPTPENGKWYQMILSLVDCLDCSQRYKILSKHYLGESQGDQHPAPLPVDYDPNTPPPDETVSQSSDGKST